MTTTTFLVRYVASILFLWDGAAVVVQRELGNSMGEGHFEETERMYRPPVSAEKGQESFNVSP